MGSYKRQKLIRKPREQLVLTKTCQFLLMAACILRDNLIRVLQIIQR